MSLLLSSSLALLQGFSRGKWKILFPVLQRSSLQSSLIRKGPSSPSSNTLWKVRSGKRKEAVQDYSGYGRLKPNWSTTWLQRLESLWRNRNNYLKKKKKSQVCEVCRNPSTCRSSIHAFISVVMSPTHQARLTWKDGSCSTQSFI